MANTPGYCVILTTAGSQEEADKLAASLVENKLAACVQITPITSYYSWKGKVNKDPEFLLLIKTRDDLYAKVEAHLSQNHSYEVPEIVQLPINQGLEGYLSWVMESTDL